jgi:hypothetical protein
MGVTKMPALPTPAHDESSDDNQSEGWGVEESDWRTSSSSEPPAPARFSLVALPSKVRNSVFRRPQSHHKKKTKDRSSTADTTRTSSASSTPRDSVLFTRSAQQSEDKFRDFWDEKLRSTMDRLASTASTSPKEKDSDVFRLLLQLYAHQDVVAQLYSSYEANAAELEFYVPQLCTFLLHGKYAKQHQLECFLMSRSGDSLPFAHRLTWFLRSFCDDAREYQSEYLSVTASQEQENSDLLTAIGMRAGVPALLMSSGLCVEEVSVAQPANLQRRRSIVFPADNALDADTLKTDESFAGHLLSRRASVQDEARTDEGNVEQISLFKQTPAFVEALTDLAEQLIPTPRPQRNAALRKGLSEIERLMLPSDVIYLPIGNSCHRVKGIRVDECFTFSTKERVPYFLCVEVLDYSVAPATDGSTKQRKRRKSRASRNQSRVFSLKLPFKKDVATAADDPSPESELSFVPSPSVSSPLPEIEEETGAASSDSSKKPAEEELDGEDGDDEKEGETVERRSRRSFQEDAHLLTAEDEQQERLGQWNLPRPRRRSIKEYSSSASARSGGQFDSFYSSWFSKKAQKEAEQDCGVPASQVDSNAAEDTALEAEKDGECSCDDVVGSTEQSVASSVTEEAAESKSEDAAPVAASAGIFSSLFSKKPKAEVAAPPSEERLNQADNPSEKQLGDASVKLEQAVVNAHASASENTSAPAGLFSALFSKKPTAVFAVAGTNAEETTGSSSEECDATAEKGAVAAPTQAVGIFASILAKTPLGNTEVAALAADATDDSASSLDPSEAGTSDDIEAEDADGEESESKEALPSDNDRADGTDASVSSLEPSEEGLSLDLDAEDADGEDTDSNDGGLFSDDDAAACEPEPSPVKEPTEKPASFASWFSRKPATGLAEQTPTANGAEAAAVSEKSSDDTTVPSECGHPSAAVGDAAASQEEVPPLQRQRDLSVSLDFADPTAWKEKFDLEDGLTDDEPDVEAVDGEAVDGVEEAPQAAEEDDEKPMIVFRERWSEKEARLRRESPFGDHPGWRLLSVIVKSNDDLRQEQFAAQLIAQCDRIFREYSLPLSLRYVMLSPACTCCCWH